MRVSMNGVRLRAYQIWRNKSGTSNTIKHVDDEGRAWVRNGTTNGEQIVVIERNESKFFHLLYDPVLGDMSKHRVCSEEERTTYEIPDCAEVLVPINTPPTEWVWQPFQANWTSDWDFNRKVCYRVPYEFKFTDANKKPRVLDRKDYEAYLGRSVRHKNTKSLFLITAVTEKKVGFGQIGAHTFEDAYEKFTWADGSPLVKEQSND